MTAGAGDAIDRGAERRRYPRHPGPFDGARLSVLETPLQLFDLSVGGCFVNSLYEQKVGVIFKIRIDFPGEPGIPVRAQVLYCRPGGYAVQFVDTDDETMNRIAEGLVRWSNDGT